MMSLRSSLIGAAALALTVAAGVATQAPQAQAQVAAKVESQTRPNFGVLLDPPTRSYRSRNLHRRYDYGRHRPDWRPGWPGGPGHGPGGQEVVLVDCGGNPGTGAVEDAVRRVRPGGTLIIRARAGACVGWLNIDKPLTIIGEGGFDPRDWTRNPTPTLQAPDGLPCMTVAQGVRVEIRDMVFASPRAGDAACLVGYGAEIVMNRVGFRHAGDEAAIYADGGLLDLRNAVVDAQTVAPAIVMDGGTFTGHELTVTGSQSGIELTPGAGAASTLTAATLVGSEQPVNFGPRAIGLMVRAGREYGRVEVSNAKICGYVEGVVVEGASVSVANSRLCKADKGAVLYNGELTLTDSRIRAETGVAAASGRAIVRNNVFSRVRDVIYAENRAVIEASGNRVWSRYDICRPRFDPRWRDRYTPSWDRGQDRGWYCENRPYPRDWWDADEGSLGVPYANDAYELDGYDRFQQGYGWYDRDGRYISDDRRRGDDRWRGGGWGR
ncbi:MAG TPA: hypothetical protein PLQ03_00695 [Brevundimonas sp.]|uniref:hypothetical protein n=2 Tax=Brevundimonas TaxID=41275 RepID=UPI002CBE4F9D|nr:hypothetical protein [Brevundimonas sp.]HRO31908.1 hypothetical protein [Brevundimonas sp.]